MKANGKDLKVFAVSGGDPTQFWAQGRMQGFVETIKAAIPDADLRHHPRERPQRQLRPGPDLRRLSHVPLGQPEVQFIQNVDIGAEHANRAIESLNRTGQVFTIGWNVSKGQLDGIEKGLQVAALDQRWSDQAAFGGPACAQFLKNGVILPNTQTLLPVMAADVAAARIELDKVLGAQ